VTRPPPSSKKWLSDELQQLLQSVRGTQFELERANRALYARLSGIGATARSELVDRAERDQRLLVEACAALASSLDHEVTLSAVAEIVVRDLADFCIVDLVDEGHETHRRKVACRDPSQRWVCELLECVAIDRSRPHLLRAALSERRSTLTARLTPEDLAAIADAQNAELRLALLAADPLSVIAVPLVAHETLVGAIGLLSSSSTYDHEDLQLAEELAHRAALAIDHARRYREARQAIRSRDDVLGMVAHDLRNPLNAIALQADVLLASVPAARPHAEVIARTAARMRRLIEDLLDATRLDAGKLSLERVAIPAGHLVADAVEAHRHLGDELESGLAPDLPDVLADRDRILQVFGNLIDNAFKFTPRGGRITIGAKPSGDAVQFWVSDTGAGISAENQRHLFDRFWQAGDGQRLGAGLGLWIVKGLIEAHDGRIWIESTPGRGSTFSFTIPVVR
jgi:signal transduction histidine kinase